MTLKKPKLTRQKYDWAKNRNTYLVGVPLRLNPVYANRKAEEAMREVRRMHIDVSKQVKKLFTTEDAKNTIQSIAMDGYALDASITSQARILTNALMQEWNKRFNVFGKKFANTIFSDVTEFSDSDTQRAIEKLTGSATINTTSLTGATKDVIKAGTQQASSLIKSISSDYLTEVQEALMRSITNPQGSYSKTIDAIDKMLQGKFKTYKNKAKNITLDQTRKAYSTITQSRMKSVGITKYRWRHAGGSQEPRVYHRDVLNGQVFSYDDPPIIDQRTGERGGPADAINCHCYAEPVIEFGEP